MRIPRRYVLAGVATVAVGLAVGIPVVASGARTTGTTARGSVLVLTKGTELFDINGGVTATFRFEPEVLSVPSGTTITWRHSDTSRDPHTITIVTNKRELPHDFEGANCKACQLAEKGHFPANAKRPVPVLNKGATGLDREGDSLLMRPKRGATVSAVVSAPAGTTLHYVCIIHPWMQATIHVT